MSNSNFSGRKPYDPTLFGGLDAVLMNKADPSDRFVSRVDKAAFVDVLQQGLKETFDYQPKSPRFGG
jgi:hypothetical protein